MSRKKKPLRVRRKSLNLRDLIKSSERYLSSDACLSDDSFIFFISTVNT